MIQCICLTRSAAHESVSRSLQDLKIHTDKKSLSDCVYYIIEKLGWTGVDLE